MGILTTDLPEGKLPIYPKWPSQKAQEPTGVSLRAEGEI